MSEADHSKTALLVMDVTPVVIPAFGGDKDLIQRINGATAAARSAGIDVLFGRVAFRTGYPEVSVSNGLFTRLTDSTDLTETNPATHIHPELERTEDDSEFVKRRVSSFAGSDLEVLLRSQAIQRLVLTGVSTSGVVLSTVTAAADLDFQIVVLVDGCADSDDDLHRVLMEKVFPKHATVTTAHEWVSTLG
jgi:nicotinamidase-related amidase